MVRAKRLLTDPLCLWCAGPSGHLHQGIAWRAPCPLTAGLVAHGAGSYADFGHLVPALAATLTLVVGLALAWPVAPGPERGRQGARR